MSNKGSEEQNSNWNMEWNQAICKALQNFWKYLLFSYPSRKKELNFIIKVKNAYLLGTVQWQNDIDFIILKVKKYSLAMILFFYEKASGDWKRRKCRKMPLWLKSKKVFQQYNMKKLLHSHRWLHQVQIPEKKYLRQKLLQEGCEGWVKYTSNVIIL